MTITVNDSDQSQDRRSLTHDTAWSILATGTRTVGAVVVFFMLARYLEERQYGLYAAALAIFLLLGAFVTLGTSHIVVKRVSSDRSLAASSWGAALLPGVTLAVLMSVLLALLGDLAVPRMGAQAILLLALAEFLGIAISVPAAHALQALDRFPQSAVLTMLWTALRVTFVAIVFFALDEMTLVGVGWALLAASLSAGLVSSLVLVSVVGRPVFSIAESKQICREGLPFSLTQISGIVLGDIDKQMLVRRSNGDFLTGIYSAGNRVVGLAATPLYAVLAATYPRFFARGAQEGLGGTWAYAKRLMGPVCGYAAAAGA
ncbi:MAG: oligosaccharide flippase family protein, partial [Acidimicrobiia bacterium]